MAQTMLQRHECIHFPSDSIVQVNTITGIYYRHLLPAQDSDYFVWASRIERPEPSPLWSEVWAREVIYGFRELCGCSLLLKPDTGHQKDRLLAWNHVKWFMVCRVLLHSITYLNEESDGALTWPRLHPNVTIFKQLIISGFVFNPCMYAS